MTSLKKRAASALLWDVLGSFSQHGSSFLVTIFLARLLDPEEFGLVGMALVVINICNVFTEFGFASALIQHRGSNSLTYSSVFYLNVGSGILLCVLCQFMAPAIADFYDKPTVEGVIQWLSLSFLIKSFSLVQKTILARDLKFRGLTGRIIVSQLTGGIAGIAMAFQGFGIYALVGQNLVGSLCGSIVLWVSSSWFPKLEFSWREVRKLTSFSTFMFLDRVATSIFSQINTIFIGKSFSPALLGYYTRAESVKNLMSVYSAESIGKVFYPVLSSIQHDEIQYFRIYYRVISVICFLTFALSGLLYIWGGDIIYALFGPKWEASVFIFQVIVLKSFTYPVNLMMVNAFVSKGKASENFWNGLIRRSGFLVSIFFGYFYGFNAFLVADVVIGYLMVIVNVLFMHYYLGASIKIHLRKIFEAGLTFLVMVVVSSTVIESEEFQAKVLMTLAFIIGYLGFNYIVKSEGLMFIAQNLTHLYRSRLLK